MNQIGQTVAGARTDFERGQLAFLGLFTAGASGPSIFAAASHPIKAEYTRLTIALAPLIERGRHAMARLSSWRPFDAFANEASHVGSYINGAHVHQYSRTIAEISHRATPAMNAIASDLTPAGPSISSVVLEEWPAGFPSAVWHDVD